MASYAYDREIIPYAATSEFAEPQHKNIAIPKDILKIRVGEAKSLYQDSLRPSGERSLTPEMEFTFMTNLLYQENRRRIISRLMSEVRYYDRLKAKAHKEGLENLVAFYEAKAKISEGTLQYLKQLIE